MPGGVEFRVLGPLEVARDGRLLDLGSRKQRVLLLVLLVDANRTVSFDRVVEEVWAGHPPPSATTSLHSYVSNLRRVLEPGHGRASFQYLRTSAGGYLLRVSAEELDASRFERLVDVGRSWLAGGEPEPAWRALTEAVGLWRGEAYADIAGIAGETFARAEIARLEELRITAAEDRFDAALALGQHHRVVAEIEHVLAHHALRERLHGQLILALYRCGRQADALAAYRRTQAALAEELGIDPGPALRRLEAAVLAQSPDLELAPSRSGPPPVVRPAEAPRTVRGPVGRDAQMREASDALSRALSGRGAEVLITGEPGIGKTLLAETLADGARGEGAEVRWARCLEGEGPPAFWPWIQLLRGVIEDLDDVVLREVAGVGAGELSQLLPELARRLGITAPEQGLDAASARFRLNDAVCRLLLRLARRRPLVLVLDDLQWWDAPSLALLSHVTSQLGTARILLVATLRDTNAQQPPLMDLMGDLARTDVVARIPLAGLTARDVAANLARLTSREISPGIAEKVHRRTGGTRSSLASWCACCGSRIGLMRLT